MKAYLTAASAAQVFTGSVRRAMIQVNTALTGTITVVDGTSGSTANVAVITNPVAGDKYEYWDFQTGVRIIPSATCDITVNVDTK